MVLPRKHSSSSFPTVPLASWTPWRTFWASPPRGDLLAGTMHVAASGDHAGCQVGQWILGQTAACTGRVYIISQSVAQCQGEFRSVLVNNYRHFQFSAPPRPWSWEGPPLYGSWDFGHRSWHKAPSSKAQDLRPNTGWSTTRRHFQFSAPPRPWSWVPPGKARAHSGHDTIHAYGYHGGQCGFQRKNWATWQHRQSAHGPLPASLPPCISNGRRCRPRSLPRPNVQPPPV